MPSHLTVTATLLILSMAWPLCALAQAGQVPGTRASASAETVDIKALPRPASWMNVPKDFRRLAEDSFSITASKETDLYNNVDQNLHLATAPMLLFPADDTFVLTTAVTVDFKREYDGGFLVVYADPDHWVKLLFEQSHYGPFSVCSGVTNVGTDDSVHTEVPGKVVFLRITRAKDVFGLYYSLDGQKWFYIRYFRFPVKGPLKVGFAAQSPAGEQSTTVFSQIRYSPKAVGDFWTGEPEAATPKPNR